MRSKTTLISLLVTFVAVFAACSSDAETGSASTDPATVESLPFASDSDDGAPIAPATDDAADDVTGEELILDDQVPAPDVATAAPLAEDVAEALLDAATPGQTGGDTDDAEPSGAATASVIVGTPTVDDTHVGTFGVTAEHLMRELTLAYDGQGEMLGEPSRTDDGGSFSFSLTAVTIGESDSHRVDVTFSYVNDPDEPEMIIGHRAESISLTPFELAD